MNEEKSREIADFAKRIELYRARDLVAFAASNIKNVNATQQQKLGAQRGLASAIRRAEAFSFTPELVAYAEKFGIEIKL